MIYSNSEILVSSPGRINLLGEHTDYNNGFVLPAAINKRIEVTVKKNDSDYITLRAEQYKETYGFRIDAIRPLENHHWANYILGVINEFLKRGYRIDAFDAVIKGDIPIGAGMSSSAALECAAASAISELFKLKMSKRDIVKIAQLAEHTFAGVQCGIMDMFASVYGKKDHAIKLDCKTLEHEYIPLNLQGYKIVLFNTNVKHNLASSEYNKRREECEKGVRLIKVHHPEVESLRDVTVEMLEKYINDPLILKRCKYVVEENSRVLAGCEDLQKGDLAAFGKKMFRTHEGLSKEYEVSCPELDYLVNAVKKNDAVVGARMMGGGFGGCTINIIKEEAIDELSAQLSEAYQKQMLEELSVYIVETDDGTSVVNNN